MDYKYSPPRNAQSAPHSSNSTQIHPHGHSVVDNSQKLSERVAYSAPTSRENHNDGHNMRQRNIDGSKSSSHRNTNSAPYSKVLRYRRAYVLPTFLGWYYSHSPNRISNRQSNHRRFNSEPPQIGGRGQGQVSGSLPPAPRNRPIVAQNGAPYGMPSTKHRFNENLNPSDTRRLKSLPPRKPGADSGRTVKSAPDNDQPPQLWTNPRFEHDSLPKAGRPSGNSPSHHAARSRNADYHDSGTDVHTKTHGIATRSYEETYQNLRPHKFASSWARVRADNPTFMENAPGHITSDRLRDDSHSPGRTPKNQSTRDHSPHRVDVPHSDTHAKHMHHSQSRGRNPYKHRVVKKPKPPRSKSPRTGIKSSAHDENHSPSRDSYAEDFDSDGEGNGEDSDGATNNRDDSQADKKSPRRQHWDESVVLPISNEPPPKLDAKRCRYDLTFKPAVNTKRIVTKAYSGQEGLVHRDQPIAGEGNLTLTDDEEDGYSSPGNDSSTRSYENSPDREGKERMLTRREARMYIKMMNVYGSDAFKNQRKQWFVKRLNEVQEAKSKFEGQEKRDLQRKKEEARARQTRQLNYIRKRFREDQMHRFQTQYVTARVLEYEQANRHMYGLPEDFEDLAFLLREDEDPEEIDLENNNDASKENRVNGDSRTNDKNPYGKNQKSTSKAAPNKSKTGKKDKERAMEAEKVVERQREQERVARQNQSAWYMQSDTSPNRQESPTSHGTSGYESGKGSSEHNGHLEQEPSPDIKPSDSNVKQKFDPKRKERMQKGNTEGQNRLDSQKHIYEKKTQPRRPNKMGMPSDNVNKTNQRKPNNERGLQKTSKANGDDNSAYANSKDAEEDEVNISLRDNKEKEKGSTTDASVTDVNAKTNDKTGQNLSNKIEPTNGKNKIPLSNQNQNPQTTNKIQGSKSLTGKSEQPSTSKADESSSIDKKNDKSSLSTPGQSDKKDNKETKRNKTNTESEEPSKPKEPQPFKKDSDKTPPRSNFNNSLKEKQSDNKDSKTNNGGKADIDSVADKKSATDKQHDNSKATNRLADSNAEDKSKSTISAATNDKSKSSKPPQEDEGPVNIKRVPLAGTISKENDPRAFGVVENKLGDTYVAPSHSKPIADRRVSNVTNQQRDGSPKARNDVIKDTTAKDNVNRTGTAHTGKTSETPQGRYSTKGRSAKSVKSQDSRKAKSKKNESLADKMFNIKTGPTWNPKTKMPKMEGIDTVVVTGKDSKGRTVKKKRDVDAVVREASNLLNATDTQARRGRPDSRLRPSRTHSPAMTLGSDFDVDDDFETEDDIFERLRKKYNINVDSDDEDGDANIR